MAGRTCVVFVYLLIMGTLQCIDGQGGPGLSLPTNAQLTAAGVTWDELVEHVLGQLGIVSGEEAEEAQEIEEGQVPASQETGSQLLTSISALAAMNKTILANLLNATLTNYMNLPPGTVEELEDMPLITTTTTPRPVTTPSLPVIPMQQTVTTPQSVIPQQPRPVVIHLSPVISLQQSIKPSKQPLVIPPAPAPISPQQPVATQLQPLIVLQQPLISPMQPIILIPLHRGTTPPRPMTTTPRPITTSAQPVIPPQLVIPQQQPMETLPRTVAKPSLRLIPPRPMTTPPLLVITPPRPVIPPQQAIPAPPQPMTTLPRPVTTPPRPVIPSQQAVTAPPQPVITPPRPVTTPPRPVIPPQQAVTTPPQPMTTPPRPVIPPQQMATAPPQPMTTPPRQVTTLPRPVIPPQQAVTASPQPVITPPRPVTTPPRPVIPPQQAVTIPPQPMTTPLRPVIPPQQMATAPPQPVTTPPRQVTTPPRPVIPPQQAITSPKPVTTPHRPVIPPQQAVTAPPQPVTTPRPPQTTAASTQTRPKETIRQRPSNEWFNRFYGRTRNSGNSRYMNRLPQPRLLLPQHMQRMFTSGQGVASSATMRKQQQKPTAQSASPVKQIPSSTPVPPLVSPRRFPPLRNVDPLSFNSRISKTLPSPRMLLPQNMQQILQGRGGVSSINIGNMNRNLHSRNLALGGRTFGLPSAFDVRHNSNSAPTTPAKVQSVSNPALDISSATQSIINQGAQGGSQTESRFSVQITNSSPFHFRNPRSTVGNPSKHLRPDTAIAEVLTTAMPGVNQHGKSGSGSNVAQAKAMIQEWESKLSLPQFYEQTQSSGSKDVSSSLLTFSMTIAAVPFIKLFYFF